MAQVFISLQPRLANTTIHKMAVLEILLPRLRESNDENVIKMVEMTERHLTGTPGLEILLPVQAVEASGKEADLKGDTYFLQGE